MRTRKAKAPDRHPQGSCVQSEARLLRLHEADNVLTVIRPVLAGELVSLGNRVVPASATLGLGHKIAARDIRNGEKILKYGVPIGSATQDIRAGEHVHTHNLKSDYLPTILRDEQAGYFQNH